MPGPTTPPPGSTESLRPATDWPLLPNSEKRELADRPTTGAEHRWDGLNDHGRDFIREMNRLGMIVNVSHSSDPTLPHPMEDASNLALLTAGVLDRGWSVERIRKFLGANLLRVSSEVTQ